MEKELVQQTRVLEVTIREQRSLISRNKHELDMERKLAGQAEEAAKVSLATLKVSSFGEEAGAKQNKKKLFFFHLHRAIGWT